MNLVVMKSLMKALWKKYEYASILSIESTGKNYSVSAMGHSACQIGMFCQNGYVIKAYDGSTYCEYSFNQLEEKDIPDIVDKIDELFKVKKQFGDNVSKYDVMSDEKKISFSENDLSGGPQNCSDQVILEKLSDIRDKVKRMDERVHDAMCGAQYQIYTKYFISPNKEMSEKVLWMTCNMMVMVKNGEVIKSYYKAYSDMEGMRVLDKLESDLDNVVKSAIELLDTKTITPGEYDCICTPEVTGMIVHEAFGHGVEMDMFVKERALAKDYIGKQVASELVTMHDGALSANEVASYDFDDEGMDGQDTIIIEKGILKKGICDAQSALALGTTSTGNGRRESYERKAYTRMTNTFFEGGKDSPEAMIKSIKYGFLLENATCGMEDPKNWGIQCMVNMAREIKDGEFTGVIYSPIVLSGYVPDLLKSISMMSPKVELCGSGFCGKGYKEWVKVSDGGPYIKARIKLG